ncbi:hypothetical protein R1flu_027138 [Riccia fluitans]|uniref:Alpha/beta hydrolase fold-3 domain-containing protein n=1 Tax=Riccia fluitans TaxID=41844 RepID=A0ABD1XI33_9MARC
MASEGIANDYSSVRCFHDHEPWPTGLASEGDLTEAYHGIKNFIVHPDSTVTRPAMELVPPNAEFVNGVASKDVMVDEKINLWARIYVPEAILTTERKLPVILYFHGGGFVCLSVHSRMIHDYCESVCRNTNVIIFSVEYRKAPDYRLPTQYEDAFKGLRFLQSQAFLLQTLQDGAENAAQSDTSLQKAESEPWLTSHADFSRIYYMGDSAGGNLVHHLSVKAAFEDIRPLKVRGQILVQPGVGGATRTAAELCWALEKSISLRAIDLFWDLALPVGAGRNHWACHVVPRLQELMEMKVALPDTLLVMGGRDPLQDWQQLFYETQKQSCTKIQLLKYEEAIHGFNMYPTNEWTSPFLKQLEDLPRMPQAGILCDTLFLGFNFKLNLGYALEHQQHHSGKGVCLAGLSLISIKHSVAPVQLPLLPLGLAVAGIKLPALVDQDMQNVIVCMMPGHVRVPPSPSTSSRHDHHQDCPFSSAGPDLTSSNEVTIRNSRSME